MQFVFNKYLNFYYLSNSAAFTEGPEGVKWELGFAYFRTEKIGFGLLGLGTKYTNMRLGDKYTTTKTVVVAHFRVK